MGLLVELHGLTGEFLIFPFAANADGYIYEHEIGFDDGTTNPTTPINAFIQSVPIDIGDGEQFMLLRKMIQT